MQTCQNKRDREDSIKKALEKIALCIYTVPQYRAIYDDVVNEELTRRVVEVYKTIYRFVIDSYKYYNSSGSELKAIPRQVWTLTCHRKISKGLDVFKV
jgi:hypothetical protein